MDDESDEELPVLATPGFSEALGGVGAVTVGAGGAAGLTPAEGGFGFGGGFALNEGRKTFQCTLRRFLWSDAI